MPLFDWNDRRRWIAEVPLYASSILTPRVKSAIARSAPDCWSDDFSWLPVSGGQERFQNAFANYYKYIRAFHACRPIDAKTYLSEGLCAQDASRIESTFLSMFADIPEAKLLEVISGFGERRIAEAGRLWVILDERDFVEKCGHYLIQGSEYLLALASSLSDMLPGNDYTERLRVVGVPTVFDLRVPLGIIPEPQINELARQVLSEWGGAAGGRCYGSSLSPCLTIRQTVRPEYIAGHTHPPYIRDPHRGHVVYQNPHTHCSLCTEA